LGIFRKRIASPQDLFYGFVACSFPIFLWTFYRIFVQIPAWIIKMGIWDVIGVCSYALSFSLFESLLVWLFFLILGGVLPEKLYRSRFVVITTVVVFISAIWAAFAQLNYDVVYDWHIVEALPWLAAYFISIAVFYGLVRQFERFAKLIYKVVMGISVLATLYVSSGVIGVVIVIIRNL